MMQGLQIGGPSVAVQKFAIASRRRMHLLAGVSLLVCAAGPALAQSVTPDLLRTDQSATSGAGNGFQPTQTAQLAQLTSPNSLQSSPPNDQPADSRIGNIPTFGLPAFDQTPTSTFGTPAAAGAGEYGMGYDSLNRKKKPPKPYPGAPKPLGATPTSGAATPATSPASSQVQQALPPRALPPTNGQAQTRTPVPASVAGTAAGQPTRRRLKVDDDPFGQIGFRSGGLLAKTAIEFSGGFNTNPARATTPRGSAFYMVAPELVVTSDWGRHSLTADLRGSFTGFGTTFPPPNSPTNLDRPDFTGKINGRIDVTNDTHIDSEARLRLSTDNPGSPNIQTGLTRAPIYTTVGGTLGVSQQFNRLGFSINGSADRTSYAESHLTDGTTSTNDDRNFNQYGSTARATYELTPFLKPYAEVTVDTRQHDVFADRNGYERNSVGGAGRLGSTFELTRLVTGEASVGYTKRSYDDPRLKDLTGLLTAASLIWTVTPLTTATLTASSSIDETTLPGVSGVVSRDYGIQVDHAFRRWLIGTLRFGYGTSDYEGTRSDVRYSTSADLVYKMTRTIQIKGEIRRDWQTSTDAGSNTTATTFMLGMRFQH